MNDQMAGCLGDRQKEKVQLGTIGVQVSYCIYRVITSIGVKVSYCVYRVITSINVQLHYLLGYFILCCKAVVPNLGGIPP